MAYTIRNTDGSVLLLLGDGKIDSNSTSLTLLGKNYSNYGEIWNNNFIKVMGNFANASAPISPVKGQLWYDSLAKKLNLYDDVWEPLNGAQVSNSLPSSLSSGDLWFDSVNNQLFIKTENDIRLVGPAFSSTIGTNGWVLPAAPIQDNASGSSGNVQQVTLIRNYGVTLGLIANKQFTIATGTNPDITSGTTSTVRGLTILGDIQTTGTVYTKTLEVTSNIVYPSAERVSKVVDIGNAVDVTQSLSNVFWVSVSSDIQVGVYNNTNLTHIIPQIKATSGTPVVTWAGFLSKSGAGISLYNNVTTISTSTAINLISPAQFIPNNGIGSLIQVILTDQTDLLNIKTYRITVQYIGSNGDGLRKASITMEKLV
jgi:hypothetical protein